METNPILRQARDRAYFNRRAEQERSAAATATGKAREAHEEMADRYDALAEAAEPAAASEPLQPTRAA